MPALFSDQASHRFPAEEAAIMHLVRDLMAAPPITIPRSATLAEAAALMLTRNMSGLPVVDEDGSLVGVISEGDFLRRPEYGTDAINGAYWAEPFGADPAERRRRANGLKVGDAMSRKLVTVAADADLADAVRLMLYYEIKRLPVLEGERLVGMLSRFDFLKAFKDAQDGSVSVPQTKVAT